MKKILLLFEDYNELSTTEVYLKKVGFDVVGIGNEAKLMDQLLAFNPDIVVSGGLTQLVSSLSVGAKLKENSRFNGKSVIILPAGYKLMPSDLIKIKMDATLESPVEPLKLLQILSKLSGLDGDLICEKFKKATLTDPDLQRRLKEALKNNSKKPAKVEVQNSGQNPIREAGSDPMSESEKSKNVFADPARAARYEKFLKSSLSAPVPAQLGRSNFNRQEVKERQEAMKKGWNQEELDELDQMKLQFAKALFKKDE